MYPAGKVGMAAGLFGHSLPAFVILVVHIVGEGAQLNAVIADHAIQVLAIVGNDIVPGAQVLFIAGGDDDLLVDGRQTLPP